MSTTLIVILCAVGHFVGYGVCRYYAKQHMPDMFHGDTMVNMELGLAVWPIILPLLPFIAISWLVDKLLQRMKK